MRYRQGRYDQAQTGPASIVRRVFSLPTLLALALAAAFLVFLATRFDVDFSATWQQVRSANPLYLSLAVAVHYTSFIFRGARWRLLLRNVPAKDKAGPSLLYCSRLILLGWFANSVSWFRLGDAYRAYLYHEEKSASFPHTVGTALSERLLDAATILLLLALSLPFLLFRAGSGAGAVWMVAGTAGALLGLLGGILLVIVAARTRWLPRWLAERYRQFREGAVGSLRQAPWASLWGLLAWLAEVARLYLVSQALGVDLSLALIVFITLANSLLTLTPTPGGLGAVEAGVAGLLKQLSVLTAPTILALVLVDRSISYLSVVATGAILFLAGWIVRQRRGLTAALSVREDAGSRERN